MFMRFSVICMVPFFYSFSIVTNFCFIPIISVFTKKMSIFYFTRFT